MPDIEIMEVRAYEARCLDCGETGPIETSPYYAMVWEEGHRCVAVRIDSEPQNLEIAALEVAELEVAAS